MLNKVNNDTSHQFIQNFQKIQKIQRFQYYNSILQGTIR